MRDENSGLLLREIWDIMNAPVLVSMYIETRIAPAMRAVLAQAAIPSSTLEKKAAGTAAGFTGLFGYLIGSAFLANIGMGYIFQHFGWDGGFIALIGACVLSIGFSASTWNREKQYIA